MKIDNLKDLKKLIQLCRTTGIEAIEVDGLKMNLGPTPVSYKQHKTATTLLKDNISNGTVAPGGITEEIQIPTTGLTDEQLLFYSAQGHDQQ